ncbi:winged helix-turn-helix transcriptional regulator [Acanthopleuribacter pedis]|uniref:Helix-turn-helix transcriptional regulator n=1 Tax=Acanthopleuribacter pedis TaxID=442870 RepID=A0A8J7QH94_9BACT|nr:helix-turn-helix domain-containing protein [Acanthopleuribacter pedis]MBO1322380.1 helix-turn-helix transcriptional regulator [Acanthopleuribacter pedis]
MAIPTPGQPVRGSRSGAPIMALFDLLGRRWGMGVLWRLSEGPCSFRVLQERCETISPTILNRRLKELREAEFIVRCDQGYCLTDLGRELHQMLVPLSCFSRQWAEVLRDETEEPS